MDDGVHLERLKENGIPVGQVAKAETGVER